MSKDNVLRWLQSLRKQMWTTVPGHEDITVFINETQIHTRYYVRHDDKILGDNEDNAAEYISSLLIKRALNEIIEEV